MFGYFVGLKPHNITLKHDNEYVVQNPLQLLASQLIHILT